MLKLLVVLKEGYDESKEEFVVAESYTMELEHSLVSLSKWESKWAKPFLGKDQKTAEETVDYIDAMILSQDVPKTVRDAMKSEHYEQINDYINAKMTATWFGDDKSRPSREIITAEIIYYWMIALNIPFECQTWHLNRLLTLIKVCNLKNAPQKTMGRRTQADMQRQLNAERKARLATSG